MPNTDEKDGGKKRKPKGISKLEVTIAELALEGLSTDGAHHKQFYLEQILEALNYNVEHERRMHGFEEGVAP